MSNLLSHCWLAQWLRALGTLRHPAVMLAAGTLLCAATAVHAEAVLLVAGDIGVCDRGRRSGTQRTAELVAHQPGVVLALGDLAYGEGTPQQFMDCYDPTWGRFKERTYPVPGNHEYKTFKASGYYGYWGDRAGSEGQGYYSFNLGGWHLVAINSSIDVSVGSAQAAWLEADLASSGARCKLAFFHHPVFSSGQHGDTRAMRAIFKILYGARVSVVLSGHDHDYERFAPIGLKGQVEMSRGVRQFVVGTGGAGLRGVEALREGSEAMNSSAYGVLQLLLHADRYDWRFLAANDTTFTDQGSGSCVPTE